MIHQGILNVIEVEYPNKSMKIHKGTGWTFDFIQKIHINIKLYANFHQITSLTGAIEWVLIKECT